MQAKVAGGFMRDRVEKELIPLLGQLLSRESNGLEKNRSSIPWVVELINHIGRASNGTIRGTIHSIISLCGHGLTKSDVVRLIENLNLVDPDQVWYVLVAQLSVAERLSKDGLPVLNLHSHKSNPSSSLSPLQKQAIAASIHHLYPSKDGLLTTC